MTEEVNPYTEAQQALWEALGNPPSLVRSSDAQVGTRKYKYVNLPDALALLKPHFAKFDLRISFDTFPADHPNHIGVRTVIRHKNGHNLISGGLVMPLLKADPQAGGSALTYAQRNDLHAFLGLPQEDDDGNYATAPSQEAPKPIAAPKAAATLPAVNKGYVGAIVELVEKQGRSGEAAHTWASAHGDPEAALERTLKDAKSAGVDSADVAKILTQYDLEPFIAAFGAYPVA